MSLLILVKTEGTGIPAADPWMMQGYRAGDYHSEKATKCVTDSSGNVFVVGYADQPPRTTSNNDGYIARYDADGTVAWQKRLGRSSNPNTERFYDVIQDTSNNVIAVGTNQTNSSTKALLAKYDNDGVLQWQQSIGNHAVATDTRAYAVGTDASDNIYAAGFADDGPNGDDAYIVKVNAAGTIQWQNYYSLGSQRDEFDRLFVTATGDVYAVGYSRNNAGNKFGGVLVKFNNSGVIQWEKSLVNTASDSLVWYGVVADSSGNVYTSGYSATGGIRMILAKYNSSGVLQWQKRVTGPGSFTLAEDMDIDTSGGLYITGRTSETGEIYKYDTDGNLQWAREIVHTTSSYTLAVKLEGISVKGNVLHVAGDFDTQNPTTGDDVFAAQFPTDGTGVGTYEDTTPVVGALGDFFYNSISPTDAAYTATDGTPSGTLSAASYTPNTHSYDDAAEVLTYNNFPKTS